MRTKLFLSVMVFFCSGPALSQTFMHGMGVNLVLQSSPGYSVKPVIGIIYSPKFSFLENDHSSLSVGLPFSLAYAGSSSNQTGMENVITLRWMLDAPLMMNYNYGAGSNKRNSSKFGFFAGIGYAYHSNPLSDENNTELISIESGFGPVFNTGVRFARDRHENFEIRFSYMKATDISRSDIFIIGTLFNW